jgi:sulfite reductase beta subunit-like hemoprotein
MNTIFWKEKYELIKTKAEEFISGRINSAEFKKFTAPYGIYEQSNGKFMLRIRITGGHLPLSDARTIAETAKAHKVGYIHLTTRQDIQFQDVPTDMIYPIVKSLTEKGLPCKGGGGDTYRNTTACPHSGISSDSVFDVQPYAKAVNEFLFEEEKAFQLPRKLKLGFSCCEKDFSMASLQDLGFIAKFADGQKGFTVYAGGGMGRESMLGVKIFDFLPEKDLLRSVKSVLELFHEHGDRTNRAKARLRHYAAKVGEIEFKKTFLEYFERNAQNFNKSYKDIKLGEAANISLLKCFIPNGNLSLSEFDELCKAAGEAGCTYLRISQSQDIYLPTQQAAVPVLENHLKALNLAGDTFNGLLTCCIGATVCKIGILDSQSISKSISGELDVLFSKYPGRRAELMPVILDSIRISGCPNACGAHPSAILGLQGMKKSIDGNLQPFLKVYAGADLRNGKLSIPVTEIPADYAGKFIEGIITEFIESGSPDLGDFVRNYRYSSDCAGNCIFKVL